MVKMFGYFYGEVGGYATVEEGVILRRRYGNREEGFLIQGSKVAKVEEVWDKDKKILIKVPNKKKCDHSYKKHYGNSKSGGVYCNKCGDTYSWDYRTEEDMERVWAKAKYQNREHELTEIEERIKGLQKELVRGRESQKKKIERMKELGLSVDDL